jgi:hypothetical protein
MDETSRQRVVRAIEGDKTYYDVTFRPDTKEASNGQRTIEGTSAVGFFWMATFLGPNIGSSSYVESYM